MVVGVYVCCVGLPLLMVCVVMLLIWRVCGLFIDCFMLLRCLGLIVLLILFCGYLLFYLELLVDLVSVVVVIGLVVLVVVKFGGVGVLTGYLMYFCCLWLFGLLLVWCIMGLVVVLLIWFTDLIGYCGLIVWVC